MFTVFFKILSILLSKVAVIGAFYCTLAPNMVIMHLIWGSDKPEVEPTVPYLAEAT